VTKLWGRESSRGMNRPEPSRRRCSELRRCSFPSCEDPLESRRRFFRSGDPDAESTSAGLTLLRMLLRMLLFAALTPLGRRVFPAAAAAAFAASTSRSALSADLGERRLPESSR